MIRAPSLFTGYLLATVALAALGCNPSGSVSCGDQVCPAGTECIQAGGSSQCATPDLIRACEDRTDGEQCSLRDGVMGTCRYGACRAWSCGNGLLEPNELCDDGNTKAGDGCSSRCNSDESCGNGIVDSIAGEECDCGNQASDGTCGEANSNVPDARCRTNCRLAGCGDGIVDSNEDCEAGVVSSSCSELNYYEGELGCLPTCEFDESGCSGSCGDGIVNGPEDCDGRQFTATCVDLGADMGLPTCSEQCANDTSGCLQLGWTRSPGPPNPKQLWMNDERGLAVNPGGTLYKLENRVWRVVSTPTRFLNDLWMRAWDDTFLVGDLGLYHFDGLLVSQVFEETFLLDVWGYASDFVVAVGANGKIIEGDGASWTSATSPTDVDLLGVWGTSPRDVWAVGEQGVVLHRDANGWQQVATLDVRADLTSVWGRGPADVYVAGGNQSSGLVWNFDGSLWTPKYQLSGAGRVAGNDSEVLVQDNELFADVGNGTVLVDVTGVEADLTTLFADGQEVWVTAGLIDEVFRRSPDGYWASSPWAESSNLPSIDAVASNGPRDIFVSRREDSLIMHFDGFRWKDTRFPESQYGTFALAGAGSNRVAAVAVGVVFVYQTDEWQEIFSSYFTDFEKVWVRSESEIVAAGIRGYESEVFAVHINPTTGEWVEHILAPGDPQEATPAERPFDTRDMTFRTAATNNGLLWARDNSIYAYDGKEWSVREFAESVVFTDAYLAPNGEAFAVGEQGLIARFDGDSWSVESLPSSERLVQVLGSGERNVFAVGSGGTVLHYDGRGWAPVLANLQPGSLVMWIGPRETVFFSAPGNMRHLIRPWPNRVP